MFSNFRVEVIMKAFPIICTRLIAGAFSEQVHFSCAMPEHSGISGVVGFTFF
jgi:hypothetical protein